MIKIKLSNDEIKELMSELEDGLFTGEVQIKNNSTLSQTLYKIEKSHINKAINDNILNTKNYYHNAINSDIEEYAKSISNQISSSTHNKLIKNDQSIEALEHQIKNSNTRELVNKIKDAEESAKNLRFAVNTLKSSFLIIIYIGAIIGIVTGLSIFILIKLF